MDRERALFLCVGNTSRSQLAEAIMRDRVGDAMDVHSAGLRPGEVRPEVATVLEEIGVSRDGLLSKDVKEYLGRVHFPYVITVCEETETHCPRAWLPGGEHEFWPLDDPAAVEGDEETRLEAYRRVRDEIVRRVDEWLEAWRLR